MGGLVGGPVQAKAVMLLKLSCSSVVTSAHESRARGLYSPA